MEIPEDIPISVKALLEEINEIISKDPLYGSRLVIAQNGELERSDTVLKSTFTLSALLDPDSVDAAFDVLDAPGNLFHYLGKPYNGTIEGKEVYVEQDIPDKLKDFIIPFIIEQNIPNSLVNYLFKPDFLLTYNLISKQRIGKIQYEDVLRAVKNVIIQEFSSECVTVSILKQYILDYLYQRKKSLLLGSYYFISKSIEPDDIPKEYHRSFEIRTDKCKAWIYIWWDWLIVQNKLNARVDFYKVISMPEKPLLGSYGLKPDAPEIKVVTLKGTVNVADVLTRGIEAFFSILYFSAEVLLKYEADSKYQISDEGGIGYENVWSIYRGINRVGDEILYSNVQDLFGILPYDEWEYWKTYNIDPLSTEEHVELRDLKTIQTKINLLLREMRSFQLGINYFMTYSTRREYDDLYNLSESRIEPILKEVKKTFTRNTSDVTFLSRILHLNKLVSECLVRDALVACVDTFYPEALRVDGNPKGTLKLLLTLLELRIIIEITIKHFAEEEIQEKVRSYYDLVQRDILDTSQDFILDDIHKRVLSLRESYTILFTIEALRTKAGAAHIGSDAEFKKSMTILGFEKNPDDFLPIYRKILDDLIRFYVNT